MSREAPEACVPAAAESRKYLVKKSFTGTHYIVNQYWRNLLNVVQRKHMHTFDYFCDFVKFLNGDLSNSDLSLCDGFINIFSISFAEYHVHSH